MRCCYCWRHEFYSDRSYNKKKYLSGPSLTLDTACPSGLYALDIAMQSLGNGTCDPAIVGGTSFTLTGVIIKRNTFQAPV